MNGRRLPTAIGLVSSGGLDPRQQIPLRPGLSGPSGRTDPARGKATYLGGRHDRRATSGGGDRGGRRGGHGSARARDHGRPALGLAPGACPWRRDRVRGHVHPLSPELLARPAPRSPRRGVRASAATRMQLSVTRSQQSYILRRMCSPLIQRYSIVSQRPSSSPRSAASRARIAHKRSRCALTSSA